MKSISAVLLLLAVSTLPLAAQVPVGPELIVNQTRAGRQMTPDVGVAADGSFVVVWRDEKARRVWARRYGANGKPRGGEFRVSRLGDGQQTAPALAVRPDGSFVVVWNRVQNGGKTVGVYASRFTADGLRIGEPRLVGFASPRNPEEAAAVVVLPDGGFFVTWSMEDGGIFWEDGDTPSRDLYGRRFTRNGILVGGRVTLNADSFGDQKNPECEVSPGRELLCVWTSQLGEGWFGEVIFRRFDLDGLPLGDEVQVNEEETSGWPQRYPSLAVHEDGAVLVAWADSGAIEQTMARVVDAADQLVAPSFSLAVTEPAFGQPEVAATNEGFVIVWSTRADFFLGRVGVDGTNGGQVRVNQRRTGGAAQTAVAFGPGGGAAAWAFFTPDFHDADISVRRLH